MSATKVNVIAIERDANAIAEVEAHSCGKGPVAQQRRQDRSNRKRVTDNDGNVVRKGANNAVTWWDLSHHDSYEYIGRNRKECAAEWTALPYA